MGELSTAPISPTELESALPPYTQGVTFRTVRDDVRYAMAQQLLANIALFMPLGAILRGVFRLDTTTSLAMGVMLYLTQLADGGIELVGVPLVAYQSLRRWT